MKLIVGLGNPGVLYANSRHNIGFSVAKALSRAYRIPLKKERAGFCLSGRGKIAGKEVILSLPLVFMNLSGVALRQLIKKYKINLENLLVVCDDLDLGFGRLKIRASGTSAGHRGMKSIIESLGTQSFARLRIGIGRPLGAKEAAAYVLAPFRKEEKTKVAQIMKRAMACCKVWATEGVNEAMNIFNQRS